MKRLRDYYERELGILQGYAQEFATRYPAQAMRLGMANGAADDPHVERLIQATALLNARTAQQIDDNDRKVTDALLEIFYPHYLRPFPSAAIVHVDAGTGAPATTIHRGTVMGARTDDGIAIPFRTVHDVRLGPAAVTEVAFHPVCHVPPGVWRPDEVQSSISIGLEAGHEVLRLLIAGEPTLCAALRDALFLNARAAWIALEDGTWRALDGVPLSPAGFSAEEAMLPAPPAAHPAFRLLTEFFAFPERFNFVDLLCAHLPAGRFTLHIGLDIRHDAPAARRLAGLSRVNLLPHCTPVVNLFPRSACPIELDHTSTDYPLLPEGSPAAAFDVYSVDRVTVLRGAVATAFHPFFGVHHGEQRGRGAYYLVRRDPVRAVTHPGHELTIALVDQGRDAVALSNASVSIDLTCTSRDLPARLRHGAPGGDLQLEQGAAGCTLRFLNRPTAPCRFGSDTGWRLVSQLALGHAALAQQGVAGLRETLALYDLRQSPVTQRQIAALHAIERRPARAWFRSDRERTPVRGTELRLTVDEEAFVGTSLHLFAQVLDHFFGLCAHLNTFTQLTLVSSADGKELVRCKPRHGSIELA